MNKERSIISVIIVNYNIKYVVEQCLDSVFSSICSVPFEVILADNDSPDSSVEYLSERFPNLRIIANKHNVGFSKANNQAIRLSEAEYVFILNPDTVIGENTLERFYLFASNNPMCGGVGGMMIDGTGQFLPESKRGIPTPWNSFCKFSGLSSLFPMSSIFGRYHLKYLDKEETHQIDVLSGSNMFIRKEVLDIVGLFDEDFFMYGEDIDLSYRIVKGGYKNYYIPEKIIHYKGESTDKTQYQYAKVFYEAMSIFFKKHYKGLNFIYSKIIISGIKTAEFCLKIKQFFLRQAKQLPISPNNSIKDEIILSTEEKSYSEIIELMSRNTGKVNYLIYNPLRKITIGAKVTRFDK